MSWKEHEERRNMLDARRRRMKGNPHKIKSQYVVHWRHCPHYSWRRSAGGYWSNDIICFYYRPIKTSQEHRINAGHCEEYGEDIVRGKRRNRNLPSAWDDLPCSAWEHQKSWKKHSKRKHQWKSLAG